MIPARSLARLALLVTAALPGCREGAEPGGSGFTVRDSAGIVIVENIRPQWSDGRGWAMSREPILQIGAVDGRPEDLFVRVTSAVRLSDGRIVVADDGTSSIRLYDSGGTHVRTMGTRGAGPGEFQRLSWLRRLPGDSVLAYDGLQLRMSTYNAAGDLVREVTLPIPRRGRTVQDRFGDGTLLIADPRTATEMGSGSRREPVDLTRVSPDGAQVNPLVTLAGDERFIQVADGGGLVVASPIFFGRSARHFVAGNRLFAGDNDTYQVGVYNLDGSVERLIRRIQEPRPVPQWAIDSMKAERLSASESSPTQPLWERLIAAMPIPETLPAFDQIIVDGSGNLWIEEYRVKGAGAEAEWTVFDPEGRMLGTVVLPERFRPLEIGADYVLGSWMNDLQVQFIRMYGLTRT